MQADPRRIRIAFVATVVLGLASLGVNSLDNGAVPASANEPDGRSVFLARGCSGCHTAAGVDGGGIGPDLTDLARRAGDRVEGFDPEGYVRQSIQEPQAYVVTGYTGIAMPTLPLSNAELEAVVEYLLHGPPA